MINGVTLLRASTLLALLSVLVGGCSNDEPPPPNTGQSCQVPSQCYAGIDAGSLLGEPRCLTRVPDGYCTHRCSSDTDCCAVPGECPRGLPELCAPFESAGEMDCFLSCEAAEVDRAGVSDGNTFCQRYASPAFICRSSGGGTNNRKVCVPNG